jgi:hypothetical protein
MMLRWAKSIVSENQKQGVEPEHERPAQSWLVSPVLQDVTPSDLGIFFDSLALPGFVLAKLSRNQIGHDGSSLNACSRAEQ